MSKCYACGEPIRRGYPMVTENGEDVIICERCKRLWKKLKAEEEKRKETVDYKSVVLTCDDEGNWSMQGE